MLIPHHTHGAETPPKFCTSTGPTIPPSPLQTLTAPAGSEKALSKTHYHAWPGRSGAERRRAGSGAGLGSFPAPGGCGEEAVPLPFPRACEPNFPGCGRFSNKKRNARSKLIFHPRKETLLPVLCKAGANSTDTGVYCPAHKAVVGKDA